MLTRGLRAVSRRGAHGVLIKSQWPSSIHTGSAVGPYRCDR